MTDLDSGPVSGLNAALAGTQVLLANLTLSSATFASTMAKAFSQSVSGGKQFDDVLKSLALRLSTISMTTALTPVVTGITGGLHSMFSGLLGAAPGRPFATGGIKPFAAGGVIGTPTYFPLMNVGGRTVVRIMEPVH